MNGHVLLFFYRGCKMANAKRSGVFGAPMRDYVRVGFGVTLGSIAAMLIFLMIGMGLFIGGYVLYKREAKKPKEKQNNGAKIGGIVLMALGCLVGIGFGAPLLLDSIGDMV